MHALAEARTPTRRRPATRTKGKPDPIDVEVGGRVREARLLRGISQQALGSALGVSFQQLQKYERGTNRISASRLVHIGRALNVSPATFFDGASAGLPTDRGLSREMQALAQAWFSIADPKVRKRMLGVIRVAGEG